jgi:hypothetical protein
MIVKNIKLYLLSFAFSAFGGNHLSQIKNAGATLSRYYLGVTEETHSDPNAQATTPSQMDTISNTAFDTVIATVGALSINDPHALPPPATAMILFFVSATSADIVTLVKEMLSESSPMQNNQGFKKIIASNFSNMISRDFQRHKESTPKYGPRVFLNFKRFVREIYTTQGIEGVDAVIYQVLDKIIQVLDKIIIDRLKHIIPGHYKSASEYRENGTVNFMHHLILQNSQVYTKGYIFSLCIVECLLELYIVKCLLELCRHTIKPYSSKIDLLPILLLIDGYDHTDTYNNQMDRIEQAWTKSREYSLNTVSTEEIEWIKKQISRITGHDFSASLDVLFESEPVHKFPS